MYLYYNLDCLRVDCSTVFITFGLVCLSTKGTLGLSFVMLS